VQQGKDEVMLEFLPDTAAGEKEDTLCEMTFYVPRDNERYAGDEETPASKVWLLLPSRFLAGCVPSQTSPGWHCMRRTKTSAAPATRRRLPTRYNVVS